MNFSNFKCIPAELKLKHIYGGFFFPPTNLSQFKNGQDLGNIFHSKSLTFNLLFKYQWHLLRGHFLAIAQRLIFKANPGRWVQKKQCILQIHAANAANQLLLGQWNGENLRNSPLGVNFTVLLLAAISGRGSQVPYPWGRQKQKNIVKTELFWLLMIIHQVWLWAMLLCSNLLSFMSQIQRSMLLPWADVL